MRELHSLSSRGNAWRAVHRKLPLDETFHPRAVAGGADRTVRGGKSTFARRHFKATEILSSDVYRGFVSDDENDQAATETRSTRCTSWRGSGSRRGS
jgi:hypothetical protein